MTMLRALLLCVALPSALLAQRFQPVLLDSDGKVHRGNAGPVDIDFKERIAFEVREPAGQFPTVGLSMPCLVRSVEWIITTPDKSYTLAPYLSDITAPPQSRVRYDVTVDSLAQAAGLTPNAFNVEKLNVTARVILRRIQQPGEPNNLCTAARSELTAEEQATTFSLSVRHYGFYILVDVKPISSGFAAVMDAIGGGLLNSLAYSSVDSPFLIGAGSFKDAMVSAPFIGYETRKLIGHFQIEAVLVRSVDGADVLGRGLALGIYKPSGTTTLFKIGAIQRDETTGTVTEKKVRAFGAVSWPTLGAVLSGKRR
jgi:hypothetical protein